MISEIHCLSHPLHGIGSAPGQAERIHRHASRVRRVACDRIGAERLNAYCERVKEAFEAYMHGGWAHPIPRTASSIDEGPETELDSEGEDGQVAVVGVGERGRSKERGEIRYERDDAHA